MASMYYLHLGSNQGNRKIQLQQAIQMIGQRIGKIIDQSMIYSTEPWGLKDQPSFLNIAISCHSSLSPSEVLKTAKEIESSFGAEKLQVWGPRLMDIDILYCGDLVTDGDPKIPHPHIANRNFVLIPLMEIAGDFIDPIRKVSIEELYDLCEDDGEVAIYEEE